MERGGRAANRYARWGKRVGVRALSKLEAAKTTPLVKSSRTGGPRLRVACCAGARFGAREGERGEQLSSAGSWGGFSTCTVGIPTVRIAARSRCCRPTTASPRCSRRPTTRDGRAAGDGQRRGAPRARAGSRRRTKGSSPRASCRRSPTRATALRRRAGRRAGRARRRSTRTWRRCSIGSTSAASPRRSTSCVRAPRSCSVRGTARGADAAVHGAAGGDRARGEQLGGPRARAAPAAPPPARPLLRARRDAAQQECGTLAAAVKSLVRQMLEGTRSHAAPGCAYDLPVLAGWHHDLCARRGRRRRRRRRRAARAATRRRWPPRRPPPAAAAAPAATTSLCSSCWRTASTSRRPCSTGAHVRGGAQRGRPRGAAARVRVRARLARRRDLAPRQALVLLRAKRIALSGTQRAVDRLMSRLLCDRSLPRLSADGVDELLAALESDHCSMHAFVQQFKFCLSATSARSPSPSSCPSSAASALRSTSYARLRRRRPRRRPRPRPDPRARAPSVAAALPRPAAAAARLPGWLCALSAARAAQVGMTRCVLAPSSPPSPAPTTT